MSRLRLAIVGALASLLLLNCAQFSSPGSAQGRWITLDAKSQQFRITARQVARGMLLEDLQRVSGVEVRPTPDPEALITAQAEGLHLDRLLALLLPPDSRVTVRPGQRELPGQVSTAERPKRGLPQQPLAGTVVKPEPTRELAPVKPGGLVKAAADDRYEAREVSGPGSKRPASELLQVSSSGAGKQPSAARAPRETLRLQLQVEESATLRLIDARLIEGRPPAQRMVIGSFLYAVIAPDGRILEAGTFQDPLEEHSYQPDGKHSVGRARTGTVGISIARENLNGVLRVMDLKGVPLPRELDERTVRIALERGKPVLQLDTAAIARQLPEEPRK